MSDFAIKVENISKQYYLNKSPKGLWASLFPGKKSGHEEMLSALDNVSFELKQGEALGIIGPNGAGKSTLLQILSGVLKPSSGQVKIRGTVMSILDIGAGFHPELSGRENIYLYGNLLGMSNHSIDELFDQIVAYSGIGNFIEQAVKQYSNGMYLRLAFSVFAHLKSDILILDEVLAVGDAEFQLKSKKRIESMLKAGASVLLVGHNIGEINAICNRCILLDQGKIVKIGRAIAITEYYIEHILSRSYEQSLMLEKDADISRSRGQIIWKQPKIAPQNNLVRMVKIEVTAAGKQHHEAIAMEDDIVVNIHYDKLKKEETIQWMISIYDSNRTLILCDCPCFRPGFNSDCKKQEDTSGHYQEQVILPGYLLNKGLYTVSFTGIKNKNTDDPTLYFQDILIFKVNLSPWDAGNWWSQLITSSLRPMLHWAKKKL